MSRALITVAAAATTAATLAVALGLGGSAIGAPLEQAPSASPLASPSASPSATPSPSSSATPDEESTSQATQSPEASVPAGEQRYIVVTDSALDSAAVKARAVALGVDVGKEYTQVVDGFAATMSAQDAARLSVQDGVDYIERDEFIEIDAPGSAVRSLAGCSTTSMGHIDDGSSPAVSIGFPVNWFGTAYTSLFVNNNGGVVLNDGNGAFTQYTGIDLATATRPYILPLFTDIDTSNLTTSPVTYGQVTNLDGNADVDAFCVNWVNVGEYASSAARFSAQLLIIDQGNGDVDVEFNYNSVGLPTSTSNGRFTIGYAVPTASGNTWSLVTRAMDPGPYVDGGASELRGHLDTGGTVEGRFVREIRPGAAPTATPTPSATPSPTAPGSCADSVPAGTYGCATWGVDRLDVRARAFDQRFTPAGPAANTVAYIVDTGILTTHQEFAGRIGAYQRDEVSNDNDPTDCNGHGTHVAGTMAGANYGVAKQATIVGVRVLDCSGSGWTSDIVAGLDWIRVNHASNYPGTRAVINMSLGGGANKTLDDAVQAVINAGIPAVVAAGNSNDDTAYYSPARLAAAITVGATDSNDVRAYFSNYGAGVDIFAPGVSIESAWYTSNTAENTISGTSMASPHVAGAAAVFLGLNPSATPAQVASGLINASTSNVVSSPGTGSPNRMLYVRSFDPLQSDPPSSSPPSSNAPSGSSSSSGGGSGSGGNSGGALQAITELRPATGPMSGGNTVAIIGFGFTGATSVSIGGKSTAFTVVNDAHIDATVPSSDRVGSADVAVVLTPARGRAFAPGGYVYTTTPTPDVTTQATAANAATATIATTPQQALAITVTQRPVTAVSPTGTVTVRTAVPAGLAGERVNLTRKGKVVASATVSPTGTVTFRSKRIVTGKYRLVVPGQPSAGAAAIAIRVPA